MKSSLLLTPIAAALLAALPAHASETVLAEVQVHAERDDFDVRQQSAATRLVYGREELDRMNELTVGDYLRRLPGVTFTGPPGAPKDVRLRGMDKGYSQILINGESVPGGGKERQIQVDRLPLDLVERIEIIRAPTADLPNEGLMGTINIVLREIPGRQLASGRLVLGQVNGQRDRKGSWNASAQYGNSSGDASLLLNGSIGQRGELKTKSKELQSIDSKGSITGWSEEFEDERTVSDGFDFAPRFGYKLSASDDLQVSGFVSRTDESKHKQITKSKYTQPASGQGLTGDGSNDEQEDKLREIRRLRGEWKHSFGKAGKLTVFGVLQRGNEDKQKTTDALDAKNTLKTTREDSRFDESARSVGARWQQQLAGHKLGAGIEYHVEKRRDSKQTSENGKPKAAGRGDNFAIDENRWVIYAQDEIKLAEQHTLTPGLRLQQLQRDALDAADNRFSSNARTVSPSLHYLWQLDGRNNLRASATRTLKPPKFDDLSPQSESKSGTISDPDKSGNPELRPEKANGFELGWEHYLPRAGGVLGANAFYRDINDKIESRTGLEGSRYVSRPGNVGDARVWGVELDARPRMDAFGLPELMLRFNYTRLYSSLRDSATGNNTRIKDQPPFVYNLGFDWQLPALDGAWGINYNYTPKFNKDPANTLQQDDEAEQKLLDLYLSKRINQTLNLRLTAANLLDMKKDKYKTAYGSGKTDYTHEVEQGGRGISLALEAKW